MAKTGAIRAGRAYVELFADDSPLVRGLKGAQYKLRQFGRTVTQMGRRMMMLAAAIATPIGLGIREYMRFEEQMARVSTMVKDTDKHMGMLTRGVKEMAVEFGVSTETLAKGLYDILSAQIPVTKAMDVLRAGAKASIGGYTDVDTAISALLTTLNAYGDELGSVATASDWLQTVVEQGRITYEEAAENLGKFVPVAAAVGVSVDELGAAYALMTRGTGDAERAATALANTIETFMKNTDEARDNARKLGIEMTTAGLRSGGLLEVMQKLSKLTPDALAKIFPRKRALRGLVIATQHVKEFAIDIDALVNKAGNAEIAFQKLAHTPQRELLRAWETIKMLGRAVGVALIETVVAAILKVRDVAAMAAKWVKQNKTLIVTLAKMVVVMGLVGAALVVIGSVISLIGFTLGGLAAILTTIIAAWGVMVAVLGLLLTPVGLLITTLALLGSVLMHVADSGARAMKWLGEKFAELKETALAAFAGIADALAAGDIKLAVEILWLTLKMEWQKGVQALKVLWETVIFGLVASFEMMVHGIVNAWNWMARTLKEIWALVSAGLLVSFEKIGASVSKMMGRIVAAFSDVTYKDIAKEIDRQSAQRIANIAKQRDVALSAADVEHQARSGFEAKQHEQRMSDISKEHSANVAATETALAAAQAEWQGAIDDALTARNIAETMGEEFPGGAAGGIGADFKKRLDELLGGVGDAQKRLSVAGTFRAVAAFGLGTGDAADRTADATEESAKSLKKIERHQANTGTTFS